MTAIKQGNVFTTRPAYLQATVTTIRAGHELVAAMNRVLKPLDLTEPQYNVLSTLHTAKGEPLSLGDLRDGMVQPESNVSRIVDRLVDRGLVSREICPENRRKMDVLLTKEGRKLFVRAARVVMAMHAKLAESIDESEAQETNDVLLKLIRGASAQQ